MSSYYFCVCVYVQVHTFQTHKAAQSTSSEVLQEMALCYRLLQYGVHNQETIFQ